MTVGGPVVPPALVAPLASKEDDSQPVYIFGFGSLISHPGFDYEEKVQPCYIKNYRRVFWQGSTDHRGVPEAPGRTVTLEPREGAVTWGAAFKLAGDRQHRQRTLQYLEWREKQYDLRAVVPVFGPNSETEPLLTALTFIATSDRQRNPNYLGPAPLEDIAHQIATARGPSGPNFEYLFRLSDAMREMSVPDPDLFLLEGKVRARLQVLETGRVAAPEEAPAITAQEQRQSLPASSAEGQHP